MKCEHATEQSELSSRGDDIRTAVYSGHRIEAQGTIEGEMEGGLTILALGLNLDQHLLLSHYFNNLSNITSRFIQEE